MNITADKLIEALHHQMVGCFELAHWDTTGEGDPEDHREDAEALLAYLNGTPCDRCSSTETTEVCQGDQCITVCAECGSDEP